MRTVSMVALMAVLGVATAQAQSSTRAPEPLTATDWAADVRAAIGGSAASDSIRAPCGPVADSSLVRGEALDPGFRAVRRARPVYPDALIAGGVAGSVDVEFVVAPDGTVERCSLRVVDAASWRLVGPTLDALLHQRHTPPLRGGAPTRALVRQRVTFRIAED